MNFYIVELQLLALLLMCLCNPFQSATIPVGVHSACAECPTITIDCPTASTAPHEAHTVTAHIDGGDTDRKLSYRWSVSNGTITEGQGTLSIKIITEAGKPTTATLEIDGLNNECQRTASCSFGIE
jgi:hypothetical protein